MSAEPPRPPVQETDPRVPLAKQRTRLATFRTAQALDRTTLAWIRTALTMNSFGFAMIAFFRSLRFQKETPETVRMQQSAIHFGEGLIVIGTITAILVAISHLRSFAGSNGVRPSMSPGGR
jgi:putative membrane protein